MHTTCLDHSTSSADITNQSDPFLQPRCSLTYLMDCIIHWGLRFLESARSVNLLPSLSSWGYVKPWIVLLPSFLVESNKGKLCQHHSKGKLCQHQSYCCLSVLSTGDGVTACTLELKAAPCLS